jgi:hypothetical protein
MTWRRIYDFHFRQLNNLLIFLQCHNDNFSVVDAAQLLFRAARRHLNSVLIFTCRGMHSSRIPVVKLTCH